MKIPMKQDDNAPTQNQVRISILTNAQVLARSTGEIQNFDTLNYRKFSVVRGGIFCDRIFGPVKNLSCVCGKYVGVAYLHQICEKCDTEVNFVITRRRRTGHITLRIPVLNLELGGKIIAKLLNTRVSILAAIMSYRTYIHLDIKNTAKPIICSTQLSIAGYTTHKGSDGLYKVVNSLPAAYIDGVKAKFGLLSDFLSKGSLNDFFITHMLVSPAEFRPIQSLDGAQFVSHDANSFYKLIFIRNARLKLMQNRMAPEFLVEVDKRLLCEIVNNSIANGKFFSPYIENGSQIKSAADYLNGKQGLLRQCMLGKRIDYTGRSVLSVAPHLSLGYVELPYTMGIKLFEPLIMQKLIAMGEAQPRKLSYLLRSNPTMVIGILSEITESRKVLVIRQPALHRVSVQCFKPLFTANATVGLHPLVCKAANADFDGDTMCVINPVLTKSQEELDSKIYLKSLINPADGGLLTSMNQEMIVGLYCLTSIGVIKGIDTLDLDNYSDALKLDPFLKLRTMVDQPYVVETCAGRIQLWHEILSIYPLPFDDINTAYNQAYWQRLIISLITSDQLPIVRQLLDTLMRIGFTAYTKFGCSASMYDLRSAALSKKLDNIHQSQLHDFKLLVDSHALGIIDQYEYDAKTKQLWSALQQDSMAVVSDMFNNQTPETGLFNNLKVMENSKARGSILVFNQNMGINSLLVDFWGRFYKTPVLGRFTSGISPTEYIMISSGGRRGLIERALKVADVGYLTRKLVLSSIDRIIKHDDCDSEDYITLQISYNTDLKTLIGRTLGETVYSPNGDVVVSKGEYITLSILNKLLECSIFSIQVRSPALCKDEMDICAACYGLDITTAKLPKLGLSVGTLASQSFAEPATQAYLDAFKLAGLKSSNDGAKKDLDSRCPFDKATVEIQNLSNSKDNIVLCTNAKLLLHSAINGTKIYTLAQYSKLHVQDQQTVVLDDILYDKELCGTGIYSPVDGIVSYSYASSQEFSAESDTSSTEARASNRVVVCTITTAESECIKYWVQPNNFVTLVIPDNNIVKKGDQILAYSEGYDAQLSLINVSQLVQLFEYKNDFPFKFISPIAGKVKIQMRYDKDALYAIVCVIGENGEKFCTPAINYHRVLLADGEKVDVGDTIVDGQLQDLNQLYQEKGLTGFISEVSNYFMNVIKLKGVVILRVHVEILILCMICYLNEEADDVITKQDFIAGQGCVKILSISKALSYNKSYLAAAAFQRTVNILLNSALRHKSMPLDSSTLNKFILGSINY
jgi:DNA-directed RNA polymerase subunit beta'